MGFDVKIFAEEGRAHLTHQSHELGQPFIAVGHVGNNGDAFDNQSLQPFSDELLVLFERALGKPRDFGVMVRIPGFSRQVGGIGAALALRIRGEPG